MANPQKGEIEFEIGGKNYIYLLGMYGLAKLEQRIGKPWPTIFRDAAANGWGAATTLACFHCGLLLHHEPISEKEASILLDEMTANEFMRRLSEAWKLQFGEEVEAAKNRPQQAAAMTGNGIGIPQSGIG